MQKPMTESELDMLTREITECFSSTIAIDPTERADRLARAALKLVTEVRRAQEENRGRPVNQKDTRWSQGVSHRPGGALLSEELTDAMGGEESSSEAVSEGLSDAIGGYYRAIGVRR